MTIRKKSSSRYSNQLYQSNALSFLFKQDHHQEDIYFNQVRKNKILFEKYQIEIKSLQLNEENKKKKVL
jgi:hypothetical protein